MKEKKYPTIEEEDGFGVMTAAEPTAAYAAHPRSATCAVHMGEKDEITNRTPIELFGFYTDDPDVLEQRIAEIETDMDEVDAGIEDPEKWIEVNDFWAAMRKEHSWL